MDNKKPLETLHKLHGMVMAIALDDAWGNEVAELLTELNADIKLLVRRSVHLDFLLKSLEDDRHREDNLRHYFTYHIDCATHKILIIVANTVPLLNISEGAFSFS